MNSQSNLVQNLADQREMATQNALNQSSTTSSSGLSQSSGLPLNQQQQSYAQSESYQTQSLSNTAPTLTIHNDSQQVLVQSQVASETVAKASVETASNLGNLMNRLKQTHSEMSAFAASHHDMIDEWGSAEIKKVLQDTENQEQLLLKQAEDRCLELDAVYKNKLQELVQNLDVEKAKQLEELESRMQRQQQETLTMAKSQIHDVETEVNRRKMEVLKQAQVAGAKHIDQLSNLVATTKLRPQTTTTVITTNTETGTVVAAAQGGAAIRTGAVTAETISSTAPVNVVQGTGKLVTDAQHSENTTVNGDLIIKESVAQSSAAIVDKSTLNRDADLTRENASLGRGGEPRTSAGNPPISNALDRLAQ